MNLHKTLSNFSPLPSRRALVTGALAGGFVLAFRLPVKAANEPEQPPDNPAGQFAPNAFIRIDHAGKTTLVMPQVEMGQGVYTAVAMILADELDADFAAVTLEHAPANDKLYGNPTFGIQVTGNSNSIRSFWKPLRVAGAAARAMLVQAAAGQWQVDPASCSASNGKVTHGASGRVAAYGDLVDAASGVPVPQNPPLKDPKDFALIGKPLKRLDTPNKTDGKVVYGIDALLPGMKFATLAQCPVFGGKVAHVDDSAAKAVPGVRQIVVLDDLVAVVGDHTWAAKKGLDALDRDLGRRAEREDQFGRYLGRLARREQKGRRRRQIGRRHRQGPGAGRAGRRRIRAAVPGACAHGAAELHGARHRRRLRSMDRHPGHDALPIVRGSKRRVCRSTR